MCERVSVRTLDGSHIMMKSWMAVSLEMEYNLDSSRPSSREVNPRDNPSKMTLSVPGICTVSATVASKCTDMVVKIILACLARVELTLSALAHASELILSPWRLYAKSLRKALHAYNNPRTTAMNSIVFCLLDSLVTSNGKAMAAYVSSSLVARL